MKDYIATGGEGILSVSILDVRYPAGHVASLKNGTPGDTVIVVLSGSVRCKLPGRKDALLLTKDTLTFFPRETPRRSEYLSDARLLSIHITASRPLFPDGCGQRLCAQMNGRQASALEAIVRHVRGDTRLSGRAATACVYDLIDFCAQERAPGTPERFAEIEKIRLQIEDEFRLDVKISEYARRAAMSESTFRRLFTAYLGMSPVRYRALLRLRFVRLLTATQACSLTEAARRAGYGSLSYCCRQFRREFGLAAGELLRQPEGETPGAARGR